LYLLTLLLNTDQDKKVRSYLESHLRQPSSLAHPTLTDLGPSQQPLLSQLPVQTSNSSSKRSLCIKQPVPADKQTTVQELDCWGKDVSSFWVSKLHTFVPENSVEAVHSILTATIQFQSKSHEDYLRGRFIALFWFDYFKETYAELKGGGFGSQYKDLAQGVLTRRATSEVDNTVKILRAQVGAGRRYHMLAEKFGVGILLTLPTSIGKTT